MITTLVVFKNIEPLKHNKGNPCAFSFELPLQWRHNGLDTVSNHQPHHCLLSRLFGRRSKKTSKLRVTGLCAWNSPGPVNSPHKWPVTRKMFPFDDVIMFTRLFTLDKQKIHQGQDIWPLFHRKLSRIHVHISIPLPLVPWLLTSPGY